MFSLYLRVKSYLISAAVVGPVPHFFGHTPSISKYLNIVSIFNLIKKNRFWKTLLYCTKIVKLFSYSEQDILKNVPTREKNRD